MALQRGLDAVSPHGAPAALHHLDPGASMPDQALALAGCSAVATAGSALAIDPRLAAGDVVVADEVRVIDGSRRLPCPAAPLLAASLARMRRTVHVGPVASSLRPLDARERGRLYAEGVLALDAGSAEFLGALSAPALACVRAIRSASGQLPAWAERGPAVDALPLIARALVEWAAATSLYSVTVASAREARPDGAPRADLVFVVGPPTMRAASRLLHEAHGGTATFPVCDPSGVDLRWLAGASRVLIVPTRDASADLVERVAGALGGLGARRTAAVEPALEADASLPA